MGTDVEPRASEPSRTRPPRRVSRLTILFVAGIVLLLAYLGYRWRLRSAVDAAFEEVRAARLPITPEELDAWRPEITEGPNAALLILEAGTRIHEENERLWKAEGVEAEDWPDAWVLGRWRRSGRGRPLPAELLEATRSGLEAWREGLQLLHAAADIELCRFPEPRAGGRAASAYFRESLNALRLEALWHAVRGEGDAAIRSIMAALRLARAPGDKGTFLGLMIRVALASWAVEALEDLVSRCRLSDSALVRLSAAIARLEEADSLRAALIGTRALHAGEIRNGEPPFGPRFDSEWEEQAHKLLHRLAGGAELDALHFIAFFDQLLHAAALPSHQRLPAVDQIVSEAEVTPAPSLFRYCTLFMSAACIKGFEADMALLSRLRAARTAIAVERFHLARGKLPDTLEELVPAYLESVPADPYTGKPLRWKSVPGAYAVYSVGRNLIDEGGFVLKEEATGDDAAGEGPAEAADDLTAELAEEADEDTGPGPPDEATPAGDDVPFIVEPAQRRP